MDRAIASVVAQTSSEWELIIVDDGSEDDSLEHARRWQQLVNGYFGEKIRVISTNANVGTMAARNLAVMEARYDSIAYLDWSDVFFYRRIESLVPLVDRCDLIFAPYEIMEDRKLTLWNLFSFWQRDSHVCSSDGDRDPPFDTWARALSHRASLSVPLGATHRRLIFERTGGFQEEIVAGADGVLWRRMADQGARIAFCQIVAGRYNVPASGRNGTQRMFSATRVELKRDHPSGRNGQYLDAGWFAAAKKQRKESVTRYLDRGRNLARCVFVLSTGRVGTTTLQHLLNLSKDVHAFHEPDPKFLKEGQEAYLEFPLSKGKSSELFDRYVEARVSRLSRALERGCVYAECANRMTFLAPILAGSFPQAKFIHLYRNPADLIRSAMRRRWYVSGNEYDRTRVVPRHDDPWAAEWETWDLFEKCCWHWKTVNGFALHVLSELPQDSVFRARHESLFGQDAGEAERLFEWLDVSKPERKEVLRVIGTRYNEQRLGEFP
jgi:hypothetical protein